MEEDALPEQQPGAGSSRYCSNDVSGSSQSNCRSAALPSESSVRLPSSSSSKTANSREAISSGDGSSSNSSSSGNVETTNCSKSAGSSSTKSSVCAAASTDADASSLEAAGAHSCSRSSSSVPPLSTYICSPFTSLYRWFLRISIVYKFLIGGIWGFPGTANVFLLPQQLLRLFTLGGCGLLLLQDVVSGLRQTYTQLLRQKQQDWVQRMLLLLQHTEQHNTNEVLCSERQRLLQLVSAMRRCLAATASCDVPGQARPAAADAGTAAAEAKAEAAATEASIPHETDAAAQLAVAGDVQLAAVVFGAPREVVAAACDAAHLLHAEATQQHTLQQKRRGRTTAGAVAAVFVAAAAFIWGAVKRLVVFVCCVLLLHLCIDIPAAASAAAAATANTQLSPWWLLLLHAVARGCFAASLMNQHASSYLGLTHCRSLARSSTRSSSKNSSSDSSKSSRGIGFVPKPLNIHLRLFFAFCVPVLCSLAANAVAAVAAGSAAETAELQWSWRGLLLLPLALLQAALQLVLPFGYFAVLPLQRQRSEAAELLLLLQQQQQQLNWSMLPETEVLQEYFAAGTLLTTAAAAAACCSSPPALWVARIRLESAAAAAAAAQLLGLRTERLQQQHFCGRLRSKCQWAKASVFLLFSRLPWEIAGCLRRLFVFGLGLSWLLLLLHAFLNTPLLQQSGEAELQTPLQLLQQQLQHQEGWEGLQQTWQEILQLQRDLGAQLQGKSYAESLEWVLLQLQLGWEEYVRTSSKQTDDLLRARELFGLSEDASAAAIKQRYRQLAKLHHPDRATFNSCSSSNNNSSSSRGSEAVGCVCVEGAAKGGQLQCTSRQEAMQQINLAYELLLQQAAER